MGGWVGGLPGPEAAPEGPPAPPLLVSKGLVLPPNVPSAKHPPIRFGGLQISGRSPLPRHRLLKLKERGELDGAFADHMGKRATLETIKALPEPQDVERSRVDSPEGLIQYIMKIAQEDAELRIVVGGDEISVEQVKSLFTKTGCSPKMW